jgi:hypothetical protein
MSHPFLCLHPVCCYERSLKEEEGLLDFGGFTLGFWAFAWFLLLGALLWAFWCGKPLKGKRIIEGKNC